MITMLSPCLKAHIKIYFITNIVTTYGTQASIYGVLKVKKKKVTET